MNFSRKNEYKVLFYRLLLAYVFYFIARVLFFIFNYKLIGVNTVSEFFRLSYYGLAFDTTAILYVNALFILFSILPLRINTNKNYQKFLFYLYFSFNLIAYSINFIDFIYYEYTFTRTTLSALSVVENESNKAQMLFRFMISYWYVLVLFIGISFLWIFLYKKVTVSRETKSESKLSYFTSSLIALILLPVLMIGGIRGGDFKKSTRPINLLDASRHVTKIEQSDFVLNSPFTFIRTIGSKTFKKVNYKIANKEVEKYFKPIKEYANNSKSTPNIVLIITESFGREYLGAFNKKKNIPNYKSYTPFLDSLAENSLIFIDAYSNGSKSIHGMSSIISGIPSFKEAFTSSPYSKQKIQSLVSTLKEIGYDTSFFHGAPNGSMGFLGFGNILGFDHYYGKTEYNNDADHDGFWGIWDEPFLQFMKDELNKKKTPFFSTIFTLSSHEPYVIPEKYENKFPLGNLQMHQCVGYTDYAFKQFFKAAQKEPWFDNTIFIITADHGNQLAHDEYRKTINRNAVPILIYKPDGSLKGVNEDLAQQIDIYPTILDLVGYDKPFRSWGRSLVGDKEVMPYVMNHTGMQYQLQRGNYICTFDGENVIGFFDINDKGLEHNLIGKRNEEMNDIEQACKAFLQDYFERIIDKKLDVN